MRKLSGKRVAILVCDGFEQVELTEPRTALEDEGAVCDILSPSPRRVRAWKFTDWGKSMRVDVPLESADAHLYGALLLPGGVMNADSLRGNLKAVSFVRELGVQSKPIAAICHGLWVLIEAGLVRGKSLTSWPSLQTDLGNAGASWMNEEVVRDGMLVTSRKPSDLPAFIRKTIDMFAEAPAMRARVLEARI